MLSPTVLSKKGRNVSKVDAQMAPGMEVARKVVHPTTAQERTRHVTCLRPIAARERALIHLEVGAGSPPGTCKLEIVLHSLVSLRMCQNRSVPVGADLPDNVLRAGRNLEPGPLHQHERGAGQSEPSIGEIGVRHIEHDLESAIEL